jgi:hypothetical protein
MTITTIRVAIAGLVVACGLAPLALAAGEPKNDSPFTRQVGVERTTAQSERPATASQYPTSAGLKADGLRYQGIARVYGQLHSQAQVATGAGEAKNEAPFNTPIVAPEGIATGNDGFQWGDAGIGVATGFGLALALVGVLLLVGYRIPRMRKTGAAAAG